METVATGVKTRRAGVQDLPVLAPLFDAYRQFYGQPSDVEGARGFLADRLGRRDSVIFLADHQGKTVGFTQLYASFSSIGMRRVWILNDLFVAPEARRQKVASALLARAEKFAAETKSKGLVLETARDNVTAQAAYDKLGWTRDEGYYRYSKYL